MSDFPSGLEAALAGRYTLERELGRGGNAVVYLARDDKHDRQVALKVLSPELALAVRTERFVREIQIAARLTHPHILPLYDSGQVEGFLYYAMPYVRGESLRDRLKREKQLPLEDALRIAGDVAAALGYAHREGVVHRDIKPENILLSDGSAVVADFGIARALTVAGGETVTQTGVAVGTPTYMSPEQSGTSGAVDGRSDIYSLACVAYEMLAGRPPYAGTTAQEMLARHALDPIPTVRAARSSVPEAVERALQRALAKSPVDRFKAVEDFAAALSAGPGTARSWTRGRRTVVVGGGVLALVSGAWIAFMGAPGHEPARGAKWARTVAIPQVERLADSAQWDSAWTIARAAAQVIPGDSAMEAVWPRFAARLTIESDPPDATVYRNAYAADGSWDVLGRTPLRQTWIPNQLSRLRFVKDGYDTLDVIVQTERVAQTERPGRRAGTSFRLRSRDSLPRGMVDVPARLYRIEGVLEDIPPIELHRYLIDKYEVTNGQFREFVLAGGYRDRRYWREPFARDGRSIRWEDAMAMFVDRTGRAGPSTWEGGSYREGEDDFPLGGVSWYEAAAYARFAGKALPTVFHWYGAAGLRASAWIVPHSNYSQRGPARVGSYGAVSDFGSYDMGGNVREWCYNETEGERYILGGGWNDPEYMFIRPFAQSPWDRSATNGVRLVRYLDPADPGAAARSIPVPQRDFMAEKAVSDEVLDIYRRLFQYDPTALDARVETIDSTAPDWKVEQATFRAAYGAERMRAILYLPRHTVPPYQTLIVFPGSQALFLRSLAATNLLQNRARTAQGNKFDFVVKSGRAVVFPIYKGTYERGGDDVGVDVPNASNAYRDHVVMWAKDLRRAVDYAETRPDLDLRKLTYYGVSWGGRMAPVMLVAEPRIKLAILNPAGLHLQRTQPEADVRTYVGRVTVPVLMFSGRYDHLFPLETSALPLFQLLGTPAAQKRHVISQSGHYVPRPEMVRETLDWLDQYSGPVRLLAPER